MLRLVLVVTLCALHKLRPCRAFEGLPSLGAACFKCFYFILQFYQAAGALGRILAGCDGQFKAWVWLWSRRDVIEAVVYGQGKVLQRIAQTCPELPTGLLSVN